MISFQSGILFHQSIQELEWEVLDICVDGRGTHMQIFQFKKD